MQELWSLELADIGKRGDQDIQVVAIDRTDVIEAELLEQRTGGHHAFDVFFRALCQFQYRRCDAQYFFRAAAHTVIKPAGEQSSQVVVERADIRRNRHVVVVEDHQQVGIHGASIVECLERHASRHRPIADNGNRAPV